MIDKELLKLGWERDEGNDRAEHIAFKKNEVELLFCEEDRELVIIDASVNTEQFTIKKAYYATYSVCFLGWIDDVEDLKTVLRLLRLNDE